MGKTRRCLGKGILFLSLVWLLAACGENAPTYPIATTSDALNIIQNLEQDLNQGNAKHALEFFSEDAVVVELHPNPNTINQTSGYLSVGPYQIPRAYSAAAEVTYYRGQKQINTYLANLIEHQFPSNDSFYQEDEEGINWVCQASSQIYFKASIQGGKITNLRVTFF